MKTYKDLDVWKVGCQLVVEIYRLTNKFPAAERYGLTAQMRRAAVSIPSNIAEGFSRRSAADNWNFIKIAAGSSAELETQLYLIQELGFAKVETIQPVRQLLERTMQMLNKLAQSLANNESRTRESRT